MTPPDPTRGACASSSEPGRVAHRYFRYCLAPPPVPGTGRSELREDHRCPLHRPTYLIVGASLAGAKAAETLREEGFDGRVILLGDEPSGRTSGRRCPRATCSARRTAVIYVHEADWYDEHDVDLRLGTDGHRARPGRAGRSPTAEASSVGYDRLLLATGASPRRLNVPGADLDGVLYLRTVGDSERLRAAFRGGGRVVIVGAGWIGLETAAAAREARLRGDRDRAEPPRCTARWAPSWVKSSPICTVSTASSCGSAVGREIRGPGGRVARWSPRRGADAARRHRRRRDRRRAQHRAGRRRRSRDRQRGGGRRGAAYLRPGHLRRR